MCPRVVPISLDVKNAGALVPWRAGGQDGLGWWVEQYFQPLNLSEFVVNCSRSRCVRVRLTEAPLFSRDWLENGEQTRSVSANIYALQTAINRAIRETPALKNIRSQLKAVKKLALAVLLSYPVVSDLRDVGTCT